MIAYQNSNSNNHSTTSDKKADTKRWKIETLQQSPLSKQPRLRLNSSYLNEPWIPFKDGTNSVWLWFSRRGNITPSLAMPVISNNKNKTL